MIKRVFHIAFIACGMMLGYGLGSSIVQYFGTFFEALDNVGIFLICVIVAFLFGLIFNLLYDNITNRNEVRTADVAKRLFEKVPPEELIPGVLGLIVGGLIANLVSNLLLNIKTIDRYISVIFSILAYLIFCYYGYSFASRLGNFYLSNINLKPLAEFLKRKPKGRAHAAPKVFDTSVIIDGRIQEILGTGFIEGDIIIPDFVLVELRHISDSADELKRARGRRGLDILSQIEKEFGIEIYDTSNDKDLKKVPEVDVKLLRLAEKLNGMVVTNDYNLNKVAAVEGIQVLNINELANTLKPVSIPGEVMTVTPVKEGKNADQSIAYLEDGTMIVVQGGRDYIGRSIETYVTSVLQTAAGRMIFVKPKELQNG